MPSGAITINGGSGKDTISFAFTVTGTNTLAYATAFASAVDHLIGSTAHGGLGDSITPVQADTLPGARAEASSSTVYDLIPATIAGASQTFLIANAGYVVDTIGGAVTVEALAGGDTVIVAAINAATTFEAEGSGNQVIFVDGNNTYDGTQYDTGNDTIVAGSGFDTINTAAAGSTTVNSGTGDATIYLNDTTTGGFNDHVWLDDGHSTIYANGVGDGIVATAAGQTIYGGTVGSAQLGVVLLANSDGSANGNDLVNAGAGTSSIYDNSSSNTINGGSGVLYFVATDNITADVTGGSGAVYGYAGAGDDISIGGTGTGAVHFAAGTGNETLDGAGGTNAMYLFGGTGTQVLIGGNGRDVLTAGSGVETLTGGAAGNTFQFSESESANTSITITDFGTGSASTIILDGFTAADEQTLLSGGKDVGGNYTVTIGNSLTITFDGITSGSQLAGHIVTF